MGLKHVGMVATVTQVIHNSVGEVTEVKVKLAKLSDTNKPKAFIQVIIACLRWA